MNDERSGPVDPEQPAGAPVYAFHDPAFVQWWLDSLYLLPAQQQLASALSLRESVHSAQVRDVIDVFAGRLAAEIDMESGVAPAEPDMALHDTQATTPRAIVQRFWRTAPIPTAVGIVGLAYMVAAGIWSVVRGVITALA